MPEVVQKRKPRASGRKLTTSEREAVYQAWLVMGNKAEVARSLSMTERTVHRVIKSMQNTLPPEEQRARQAAVSDQLKGRFFDSTVKLLESIKPEDLQSGRLAIRNERGEIVGYKDFGPSVLQKATAAGIFTDKIRILSDLERATAQDQQTGQLLMPEGVNNLLAAIKGKIASISVLNVNFREDNPELATRLDAAMEVTAVDAPETNEYDEPDLRNPGE